MSTAPWSHETASQFGELEEPSWQRHFVNRLHVSTFQGYRDIERHEVDFFSNEVDPPETYECHITLLREDADNHRLFHGRRMSSTFDTSLAKQWIKTCKTAHSMDCSPPRITKRPSRVINIEEKRIQYTPPSCSYAALSYCWPKSLGPKLESSTEASLMEKGGLARVDGVLAIMEDAMTLLKTLGLRYLWVDALCIPQEGKPQQRLDEERKEQFSDMADIYYGAYFTTVSCSDPESNKGLPGIRDRTRASQRSRGVGDLAFAITKPDLSKAGEGSRWNSRVWTFQEAARSRRRLVFTDHQVFFHCSCALWCEDAFLETSEPQETRVKYSLPKKVPYWENRHPEQQLEFREWVEAVQKYTSRSATRKTDFQQGLKFLKPNNPTFCCLFEKYFALALCFVTYKGKRQATDTPTWCWCHWSVPDGVKYDIRDPFLETLTEKPRTLPVYKVGLDSAKRQIFSIEMGNDQSTSVPDDGIEVETLAALKRSTLEGSLSLECDGLENCKIRFSLLDPDTDSTPINACASATLALDCNKNEGDLVTCVFMLYDYELDENWYMVVETDSIGVSRRIGMAWISKPYLYASALKNLERSWIFLA